jgi:hypothetical protein
VGETIAVDIFNYVPWMGGEHKSKPFIFKILGIVPFLSYF